MNEGQLKTRILVLKTVDWLLLLTVFGVGIYGILYSDHQELMALAAVLGLLLVDRVGNYTTTKIAKMRVEMDIQQKRKKLHG